MRRVLSDLPPPARLLSRLIPAGDRESILGDLMSRTLPASTVSATILLLASL